MVYLRIVPSLLMAKLVKSLTTTFTLGTLDALTVQPLLNSINPNELQSTNASNLFDGLQYICRESNESWPNDGGALLMPLAGNGQYPSTTTPPITNVSGCFGQGFIGF